MLFKSKGRVKVMNQLKVIKKIINASNDSLTIEEKEAFIEMLEEIGIELRICSECNKIMHKGYVIEGGYSYYCTELCLNKNITREEYEELFNDNEGDSYYTEFN